MESRSVNSQKEKKERGQYPANLYRPFSCCKKHRHARCARVTFLLIKSPGGRNTQWTLNCYDKVNPTSLSGYDVQRKRKQRKDLFHPRKCDIKPTFIKV